jgi:restriction system protein
VTELAAPGVDLMLRRDKEKFFVQCSETFKVGVQVVRELYGVMAAKVAAGGFVVISGSFTEEAIAFASGRNVEGFGLIRKCTARDGSPFAETASQTHATEAKGRLDAPKAAERCFLFELRDVDTPTRMVMATPEA